MEHSTSKNTAARSANTRTQVKSKKKGAPMALAQLCLFSLLTLAAVAPKDTFAKPAYETDKLEIDFIGAYDPVWTDHGSGAQQNVSFWRPTPAQGWHRVGHHVRNGFDNPTIETMVVKAKPGAGHVLKNPTDYTFIWNDAGSGASKDGSVWRPICPSGYQALGDVANDSHAKPALNEIKCVQKTALVAASPGSWIWNDAGSGVASNFSVWGIQAPTGDANSVPMSRGLFYGAASYTRPEKENVNVLWAIKGKTTTDDKFSKLLSDDLLIEYTPVFDKVWDDAGSGANKNVGFFKPIAPAGYYALGHYAHASHAMPQDVVMVVKEKETGNGALRAPLNYALIWTDAGSGANQDVAVWEPRCPSNYVAFGLVTSRSSGEKPSLNAIRCVKESLTVQTAVGDPIWNDGGSGANSDFSSWKVNATNSPEGKVYATPGTFIGHATHAQPSSLYARALKLSLPQKKATGDVGQPVLHGYSEPSQYHTNSTVSTVYLPFTAVKDPSWSLAKKAMQSPFYKLVRTDRYKLVGHMNNQTGEVQKTDRSYSTTIGNKESFTNTTGITITKGWETKFEAKSEIMSVSQSLSTSVALNRSFSYEQERDKSETTTIRVWLEAKPKTAAAVYTIFSEFELFRSDGKKIGSTISSNKPGSHVFVQFPSKETVDSSIAANNVAYTPVPESVDSGNPATNPTGSADSVLTSGGKVSLQADNGVYFARCQGCISAKRSELNNTVTVHETNSQYSHAMFTVIPVGNKIALLSDSGMLVSRCQGCLVNGAVSNFATIHVPNTAPIPDYALFTPEKLNNGKYAFKADTGKYLARCTDCTESQLDTVSMEADNSNDARSQWKIVVK